MAHFTTRPPYPEDRDSTRRNYGERMGVLVWGTQPGKASFFDVDVYNNKQRGDAEWVCEALGGCRWKENIRDMKKCGADA